MDDFRAYINTGSVRIRMRTFKADREESPPAKRGNSIHRSPSISSTRLPIFVCVISQSFVLEMR